VVELLQVYTGPPACGGAALLVRMHVFLSLMALAHMRGGPDGSTLLLYSIIIEYCNIYSVKSGALERERRGARGAEGAQRERRGPLHRIRTS
jgi:hypothetical protein